MRRGLRLRRGQTSIEFLLLLGFMIVVFAGVFIMLANMLADTNEERLLDGLEAVADQVHDEVVMAQQVKEGYHREFQLPTKVLDEDITVTISGAKEILVATENQEYLLFLPEVVLIDSGLSGELNEWNSIDKGLDGTMNINPLDGPSQGGFDPNEWECGNGIQDPFEDCETCPADAVGCDYCGDGDCQFPFEHATNDGSEEYCPGDCLKFCENGVIDKPNEEITPHEGNDEVCDGELFDGYEIACADNGWGFTKGTLACEDTCTRIDASACSACGNNHKDIIKIDSEQVAIDYAEVCDGTDLDDKTCADFGLMGFGLTCSGDCGSFDTSACYVAPICGNGVAEIGEDCDGADMSNCIIALPDVCGDPGLEPGFACECFRCVSDGVCHPTCADQGFTDPDCADPCDSCDPATTNACYDAGMNEECVNKGCAPDCSCATACAKTNPLVCTDADRKNYCEGLKCELDCSGSEICGLDCDEDFSCVVACDSLAACPTDPDCDACFDGTCDPEINPDICLDEMIVEFCTSLGCGPLCK